MMCCVGDKVFARDVGWASNCRLCAGRHGCGLLDGSVCIGQVKKGWSGFPLLLAFLRGSE